MRCVVVGFLLAGCAQGSSSLGTDAQGGQQDARIDASAIDAAPPTDGSITIDATPPADAMVTTPDACVPTVTELLLNGPFDLSPAGVNWTETRYGANDPLVVNQSVIPFNAQTGTQYVYLGGYEAPFGGFAEDAIAQNVVIPPMTTQLVFSGYYAVGTVDSTTSPYDFAGIGYFVGTTPTAVVQVDNRNALTNNMWTAFSHTVPQNLSNQTIKIQMDSSSDDSYYTQFVFDSLSLRATHGCP